MAVSPQSGDRQARSGCSSRSSTRACATRSSRRRELFFQNILREDRSVLELLDANYTFLNQRLAEHYGIPNVYGPQFRKVTLTDPNRGGLLGQGSMLTVTSYPNRTSVVQRGKWILENLLGAPPPPPPPDIPELKPHGKDGRLLTLREQMEQHRANPICAVCHARMDPLGFALENYDGVGKWRDQGRRHRRSTLRANCPTAPQFEGPAGLKKASGIAATATNSSTRPSEKLLTYALGRGLEYYDKPAVRAITRDSRQGQLPHVGADHGDREEHTVSDEEDPGTMIITKKHLPRRTFLRGLGTTLALPLLDSMMPALAAAGSRDQVAGAPGVRLCSERASFWPRGRPPPKGRASNSRRTHEGAGAVPRTPAGAHRPGADQRPGAGRRRGRPCARGRHLADRRPSEEDRRRGHPRGHLGRPDCRARVGQEHATGFARARPGEPDAGRRLRFGYSCAYTNTISWRGPTTPLPVEVNPRAVFERLFGDGDSTDPAARLAALKEQSSILDYVCGQHRPAGDQLGTSDRSKLSEYLEAIRDIERRIQKAEAAERDHEDSDDGAARASAPEVRRARQADDGSAGDRVPDRYDARDHVHDGPRGQQPAATATSASPTGITRSRITRTIR